MGAPFWLRLAVREMRSSGRRLGTYMAAITVGVAALVAINSFRAQVIESVDMESNALLGADLRLNSTRAFPDSVTEILDSAVAASVPVAEVTSTLSVVFSQDGEVRLAQVKAVRGGYPFYGEMETDPQGLWERLSDSGTALVERTLLDQLGAQVGDSLRVGEAWFTVRGVMTGLPPELSFRNAAGPRIYIHGDALEATGLLQFGSLATYEKYLHIPDDAELQQFVDRNHDTFTRTSTGFETAAEQAENLARALDSLGRFLGLVGLSALLLGGLGVASAVNVFVKEKRRTVAVLRCLGATQRAAFSAYLLQATLIGSAGAAAGAALGVAIQAMLPRLVADVLPFGVEFEIRWNVVLVGIGIGAAVAFTFALLPLLAIRGITPLRALRHDIDEAASRMDPWRLAAFALILVSLAGASVWQARVWLAGLAYAGTIVVGLAIVWLCARVLMMGVRRLSRRQGRRRSFPVRQGLTNLYRPRNQTAAVSMALGFGVFLVATLWVVQQNLLSWMQADLGGPQPNLVLFDVQRDQVDSLRTLFDTHADDQPEMVPIVPARVTAINGHSVEDLLNESPRRVEQWAARREYRHTYRDTITRSEELVQGATLFDGRPAQPGIARVSVERDVARNLDVDVGDRITWSITGVPVESVITSVRTVDWARFETNFFFVFEPGFLEQAPQTFVSLVAANADSARAALQRDIVQRHPNISVVDLAAVQRTLEGIINRVAQAIRFMAAFSIAAGGLVLFGAIGASRFQRVRESALLRALGATRAQVRTVLLVEYAALGALGGLTGVLLAAIAGWLLMNFVFEARYVLPIGSLAAIWAIVGVVAAALGMLNSGEALRSTPLQALRDADG